MANQRKLWAQIRRRFTQVRRATNAVAHAVRGLLDTGNPEDDAQWLGMVHLAKALGTLGKTNPVTETFELQANWKNPYELLGPLSLEPTDNDFVVEQ
jgi:hypothetical protein